MDLYLFGKKVGPTEITADWTIGQIKTYLKNHLYPIGITKYKTELIFNNNEALAPVVFETDTYNHLKLHPHANQLKGSKLMVTEIPPVMENNFIHIYLLYSNNNNEIEYSSPSLEKVLKWYVDNTLKKYNLDPPFIENFGIPYPTDYKNVEHQERIKGSITAYYQLLEADVDMRK